VDLENIFRRSEIYYRDTFLFFGEGDCQLV